MITTQTSGAANINTQMPNTPLVDILQNNDSYIYLLDLPGIDVNNINLEVSASELIVSVSGMPPKQENTNILCMERSSGNYYRQLIPPSDADTQNPTANYKNGVLEIIFARKKKDPEQ